jgi:hypothetical protein
MKIFKDRQLVGELSDYGKPKKGQTRSKLVAINLSHNKAGDIVAEGVYLPAVRIETQGDITFVDLCSDVPIVTITLMPSRPFIHINKVKDQNQVEDE